MIKELVEKYYRDKGVVAKLRVGSGKFKPSLFGSCFRKQYYARMGGSSGGGSLQMDVGIALHEVVQTAVSKQEACIVESCINIEDVLAYVDLEVADAVVEIKSTDCKKFKAIKEPKKEHVLQGGFYAIEKGASRLILIYIDRCGGQIKEFELGVDEFRDDVEAELGTLRKAWAEGVPPPKWPRLYYGHECKFCGFAEKCEEDGEGRPF